MQDVSSTPVTPDRPMQFTGGYGPPLIVETAIRLRIFNFLDEGAKGLDELVSETGASARGLRALLNALVGLENPRSPVANGRVPLAEWERSLPPARDGRP